MAGRRTKLTPEVQRAIVKALSACGTFEDAAAVAGVGKSTLHNWRTRGEAQRVGPFREFVDSLEVAVAKRRRLRESQILKAGKSDWRAIAWVLERTEPTRYAPRVRVHVQQELTDAIDRLKEAFTDEPETFERALHAIAGPDSGARIEAEASGESGADDLDGGEAVLATLPEP